MESKREKEMQKIFGVFETWELMGLLVSYIENAQPIGRKTKKYNRIREYFYLTKNIPVKGFEYHEEILEHINCMCAGSIRNMFYLVY